MVGFVQGIRDGDCSGVAGSAALDGDDDAIAAADSPTQLSIGNSEARLYVGGVVGNFILGFSLMLLGQFCGTIFLKRVGSTSWGKSLSV